MVIYFPKTFHSYVSPTTFTGGKLPPNLRNVQCLLNSMERSQTIINNNMDVL